MGQLLCRELRQILGEDFKWSTNPYEYQFDGYAIDYINGSDEIRQWVDSNGSLDELKQIEEKGRQQYLDLVTPHRLY